jgi:hypothetical protein
MARKCNDKFLGGCCFGINQDNLDSYLTEINNEIIYAQIIQ